MPFFLCASTNSKAGFLAAVSGSAGTDPNYFTGERELTSGPRSELVQFNPTSAVGVGVHYTFTGERDCKYCLITRADLAVKSSSAVQVYLTQESSGGTVTAFNSFSNLNSYASLGPRGQDVLIDYDPVSGQQYGAGFRFRHSAGATITFRVSDVLFLERYDIGYPTRDSSPAAELVDNADEEFLPLDGYNPYYTDRRYSLNWSVLTQAELQTWDEFVAQSECLRNPCVIYDTDADLFEDKTVHCVLENYQIQALPNFSAWSLATTWRRLKVYL